MFFSKLVLSPLKTSVMKFAKKLLSLVIALFTFTFSIKAEKADLPSQVTELRNDLQELKKAGSIDDPFLNDLFKHEGRVDRDFFHSGKD